jgi:hypothetical protein
VWFCLVWLWPVDYAWFRSASAVARSLWRRHALCRLWLQPFLVVPFLGVCVSIAGCNNDMSQYAILAKGINSVSRMQYNVLLQPVVYCVYAFCKEAYSDLFRDLAQVMTNCEQWHTGWLFQGASHTQPRAPDLHLAQESPHIPPC